MKKRILTVLLAVCLVFALGTVTALADGNATSSDNDVGSIKIGDATTYYTDAAEFVAAVNSATEGAVVDLKKDIDVDVDTLADNSAAIVIDVNMTFNGNGHKITAKSTGSADTKSHVLSVEGNVKAVINGLTIDAGGVAHHGIHVYNGAKAELNTVTISNYCAYGLVVNNGGASVEANNFEVLAGATGCWGSVNVDAKSATASIEVNGGNFAGDFVFDSQTSGKNTAVLDNVVAGTIKTNTNDNDDTVQSNGTNNITITDSNVTTISLNGAGTDTVVVGEDSVIGSITSTNTNTTNKPSVTVNDSTVTNAIADNSNIDFTANNSNVGGELQTDSVAKVGNQYFDTLQDAIDAAPVGGTVTLLKDVTVSAAGKKDTEGAITITKDVTIDGGSSKHKIEITNVPNNDTPSAINIQNNANVTLKNLVIDSNGAKHGLNIYNATAKIQNVEIMDSDWYAVVCNSSKLTIDGLYTHGNDWGINVDSKTSAKSDVTINDVTITETDSIVLENSNDVGSNLVINGGTFNNIKKQGDNTNDIDVDVNGGTFGMSIITVADEHPDYQVRLGSRYSYYDDADDALNAAGTTGVVTYVGPNTTVTHDVTLYYDKDHVVTLEVADEGVIYLPSGYFDGKHIDGWDERYGGNYKPGAKVTVERDMYFTVILRNGQYNIVIDDDIKHGDVSTDVSSADKGATVYIYVDPDIGYVLDDLDVCYGYRNQYSVNVKFVRTGVYSFIMPGNDVYITATFRYESLPFTDVNRSQWFYDEVYYVYTNGMMEGDSATTFNPDGRMTRAMFWAVLGRIDGATITGNDWAEEARAWAMREGVSDGTNPNDYVTREQMVTMLWRYAGEKNGSASLVRYTDADKISSYAVEAMRWAIGNGIIEGMTSTTLEPQGTATRAQCAAIFMRFDQM